MIIVSALMLLAPGLISTRILWRSKPITRGDYKLIASDYAIYSFLIMLVTYGFMFFTYPERTVSFVPGAEAMSHILSASFVFKYSLIALVASLILPAFIPWIAKIWRSLEDNRNKGKTPTKKK